VPFPVPGVPPVIVIHAAPLVAVQLHPAAALTVIVPVPAVDARLVDEGETVGEQVAPDWFTVNVLPPTDIVPTRDVVDVFAATA
jgi:hypothetical protein